MSSRPPSNSSGKTGGYVTINVTSPSGCTWSASEQTSWITIAAGSAGSGTGTVRLAVAAHTSSTRRTASATVAGHTVFVSQSAETLAAPTGFRIVGK